VTVNAAGGETPTTGPGPTATSTSTVAPTTGPGPTATSTSGVTNLPSTGVAPTDATNDRERWGALAALGGAAALLAARVRKAARASEAEYQERD
jgi:hypothetical protein